MNVLQNKSRIIRHLGKGGQDEEEKEDVLANKYYMFVTFITQVQSLLLVVGCSAPKRKERRTVR